MKDLLLRLVVITTVVACSIFPHHLARAQEFLKLKPLGTADGKDFFYNVAVGRTWDEADQFCKSHGMHLPSFDTRAQLDVVVNSTIAEFNLKCYWTSARDSINPSQHFSWNDTGRRTDLFGSTYEFDPILLTCLRFCKLSTFSFTAASCVRESARTVCETTRQNFF